MSDIVERAKAALRNTIPGPWEAVYASPTMNGIPTYQVKPTGRPGVVLGATTDGESALFIAASRTLIPELVAEVERLRWSLAHSDTDHMCDECWPEEGK